jgi:hypothetical protein
MLCGSLVFGTWNLEFGAFGRPTFEFAQGELALASLSMTSLPPKQKGARVNERL